MSGLDLFNKNNTRDDVKKRILDQISNSPKAGIGPSWFAEVVSEICVEINAINDKIADLQSNHDVLEGLKILDNRLASEINPSKKPLDAPNRIKLVSNELWDPADGFYAVEWDSEGIPFRWTGPHRAFRFLVTFNRDASARLVLTALFSHAKFEMAKVLCRIDGKLEPVQVTELERSHELHADVPAKPGSRTLLVEFELPDVQPAAHPDPRVLGIAVHSLTIKTHS
ncbi:hypothetical protein [Methylobacterium dankookense]|uniref:Uncharacterized protein n=1 Tax=Methylobacterium dankookense TaxID=560405 RepID=A0A564FYB4_9HYPH|nr:hypothetical protein [Methylobacterium dankookense]GJD54287.1 hypothetical protein IFDJLNFL_0155 [Methylobacterium dankookense]VUF12982.1 hypothetical protein MTDSW087_02677 [Methylobacterium dankookense]